jgi:hypothetical protein
MRGHSLLILVLGALPALAAPPPEVPGLGHCGANRECLLWSAATGATEYRLYRGGRTDLAGLADSSLDVCDRGTYLTTTTGPTIPDSPAPGGLLFYLVTGASSQGEGTAGSATFGVRIPNSRGPCAFECDPGYVPQPNVGAVETVYHPSCPAGMVPVSTFCIDKYEAAIVKVADGTPWSPYLHVVPGTEYRAISAPNVIPQTLISGTDSSAACQNAGKRLCTDTEWLRACRGPSNFLYPYGNTRIPGACNDERATTPVEDYFGDDPPDYQHRCLSQIGNSLDPTGASPGCTGSEGVYDMVGNLHEWTAAAGGTFRGGWYVEAIINGVGCTYSTTAHDASHWDYTTGFRCCADPL